MDCEQAHAMLDAYLDGELDALNAQEFERHTAAWHPSSSRLFRCTPNSFGANGRAFRSILLPLRQDGPIVPQRRIADVEC